MAAVPRAARLAVRMTTSSFKLATLNAGSYNPTWEALSGRGLHGPSLIVISYASAPRVGHCLSNKKKRKKKGRSRKRLNILPFLWPIFSPFLSWKLVVGKAKTHSQQRGCHESVRYMHGAVVASGENPAAAVAAAVADTHHYKIGMQSLRREACRGFQDFQRQSQKPMQEA